MISPVDLQVLAWTTERQDSQLQAFNRTAFQKIGGIEGLMTRYLKTTLDARVIPHQREAAIKVLLAMTNLERNVRVGALTIENIQQKTQGTLTQGEIVEAVTWLASGGVRLITTIEQDGDVRYELAHERLIPALREVAGKELSSADRANQLLDRRVNEWLGNQKSDRYLFNWQELRLFQQQKPYLVWGTNKIHKEKLLKCSWRKLYRQLVAVAMALIFCLVGIGWWHTPWGQIQQVRWELAGLSKRVSYEYREKAALAFFKDEDLEQALAITDSIKNSYNKAWVLSAIAETYGKLENFPEADRYLGQAITAAEAITDSFDKARVLTAIAQTIGKLENFPKADRYLGRAITAAEAITDSYNKAWVLRAIAQTIGKLENFPEAGQSLERAFTAAEAITDSYNKAWVLTAIAETIGKLENFPEAGQSLERAFTAAEAITNSSDKARVLTAIAETIGKLENFPKAGRYLGQAITAAEAITNSSDKARVLTAIAETIGKLENFPEADRYLGQAITAAEAITNSSDKAWVLRAIAQTYGKLENFPKAGQSLERAITAAEAITNSSDKAWVLRAIAQTIGKLENFPEAGQSLERAITAAEAITNSSDKARILTDIVENQVELDRWRQAHNTVNGCPTDECKVESLAQILTAWAEKKNPALVDKEED